MAVGDQILKSWLRQKYTDNNTLKSTFGSGTTLTVPDTSNSSASDTDINTLVTSLRAMRDNVYLRYSPLWSSVNIDNVSDGTLIAHTKKKDIDDLTTDLLAMNARYTKTATEFAKRDNNVSTFTFNSANAVYSRNSRVSSFEQFSNAQFAFNSSNLTGNNRSTANFGFNTSNNVGFQFFSANGSTGSFSNNFRASFTRNYRVSSFTQTSQSFSQNTRKSTSSFFNFTNNPSFSNDTARVSSFTQNSGNATAFTRDTRFSQRFRYDFTVKSDGSTVTNSNVS